MLCFEYFIWRLCFEYLYMPFSNLQNSVKSSPQNTGNGISVTPDKNFSRIRRSHRPPMQWLPLLSNSWLRPCLRLGIEPTVAGWIPNRRPALELHFLQLVPRLSLKMYIYPTLEFSTPYFNFHLTDNECTCQLLLWAEVLQSWTKLLGH